MLYNLQASLVNIHLRLNVLFCCRAVNNVMLLNKDDHYNWSYKIICIPYLRCGIFFTVANISPAVRNNYIQIKIH